jgi:hypothetical protein
MNKAKTFYFTLQDKQVKEENLDWFEPVQFENLSLLSKSAQLNR